MGGVHAAQSAIVRTGLSAFDLGIGEAEVVAEVPLFHLQVKIDIAENDVFERPVLRASLLHNHFAVVLNDFSGDDLGTFGAEGLGRLRQSALQGLDRSAGVGDFGLQDAKAGTLLKDWCGSYFGRYRLGTHCETHLGQRLWDWKRALGTHEYPLRSDHCGLKRV